MGIIIKNNIIKCSECNEINQNNETKCKNVVKF